MKSNRKVMQTLALVSQLGFSIITPILFCIFFGIWLEDKYNLPVLIPLIILGVLAGGRNAWVLAKQAIYDPEDKKRRKWY